MKKRRVITTLKIDFETLRKIDLLAEKCKKPREWVIQKIVNNTERNALLNRE